MAVANRYSVRDFRLLSRLGGAGYSVLARLDHRRPRRYSRLMVMGLKLLSPSYPLDFWLGKGRPLSPEAHGRLCLNYLKWYHLTAISPWVTLEELLGGLAVSHSWRMVAVDEDLVRFSLEVVYRSALLKCINQAVSPKILSLSEAIVNWGTIEPMVSTSLLGKGFPGDSFGSCALEVDMSGCLSAHRSDMRERPCLSAFEGFLLACLLSKLFDPALL
ncbi:hypothetical protein L1987_45943 [Smallanthus sonchifolius]|uniref:Uncharacterized protein n=1 Tax=Smallanthus sonchifolius TaxID=185202 RepID=A0ACB9G029_9ASTR|nr:hypothetical protein L1987_45943 [Smallanthus sonchifolius]